MSWWYYVRGVVVRGLIFAFLSWCFDVYLYVAHVLLLYMLFLLFQVEFWCLFTCQNCLYIVSLHQCSYNALFLIIFLAGKLHAVSKLRKKKCVQKQRKCKILKIQCFDVKHRIYLTWETWWFYICNCENISSIFNVKLFNFLYI